MLASYLARQYAMYAIANQYQQQNTNLVIPSVCFQSTPHVEPPGMRSLQQTYGQNIISETESPDNPMQSRRKQKSQNRKEMCSEIKFSIDRILAKTDDEEGKKDFVDTTVGAEPDDVKIKQEVGAMEEYAIDSEMKFSWLNCTRYKPPKLQRVRKKEGGKKRKLGRNPRVPFSQQQVSALEQKFCRTHYLSSMDVAELSTALNLTETRVKIWFQNRRARERRDRDAKRRLCVDLEGSRSNSHVVYTSSSTATTSTWRMSQIETPATFTPFKDMMHAGTSAFTPINFSSNS